ncbi:hypothetical protein [Mariniblastus fucicola]|nr:hypothetical protein [Mariniblastus fucicola]
MHAAEISSLNESVLPLLRHYVADRFDCELGNTVEDAPLSIRNLVLSDKTVRHIYEFMTTRGRGYCLAAFDTVTPEYLDYVYTQTDWPFVENSLFIFGHDGSGGTFVLNLNDRRVYHIDVAWGQNGWIDAVINSWDTFNRFAQYIQSQIRAQWNEEPIQIANPSSG